MNERKLHRPSVCPSISIPTSGWTNSLSWPLHWMDLSVNRAGPTNSCLLVACLSMRSVPQTLNEIDLMKLVLHVYCKNGCTTLTLWPLSACQCMNGPTNCQSLGLSTKTPRKHWLVHLLRNLLVFPSFLLISDLELLPHYVLSRKNQNIGINQTSNHPLYRTTCLSVMVFVREWSKSYPFCLLMNG